MAVTYSKQIEHKIKIKCPTSGEVLRVYKFKPMAAHYVVLEATELAPKIAAMLTTAQGMMTSDEVDAFGTQSMVAPLMFILSENFTPEYKEALIEKVLGKLYYEGELIEDVDLHFDGDLAGDYLQIVGEAIWLTFKNFFLGSTLIQKMMPFLKDLTKDNEILGKVTELVKSESTED